MGRGILGGAVPGVCALLLILDVERMVTLVVVASVAVVVLLVAVSWHVRTVRRRRREQASG